jgi:hypothetical protein
VVTAFGANAGLSIGQRAVAPGENEITAARALLAALSLDGALVTGDAAHAQTQTATLVLERGGNYVRAQGEPAGDAARGRGLLRRPA